MIDAISSPRAQLVELLWQLKQNFDQENDSSLRFVHFNTLLNDPVYRAEIITRAIQSDNRKIRALGLKLQEANRDGVLLHKRPNASLPTPLTNPDIAETLGSRHTSTDKPSGLYAWIALAVVVLCMAGYFAYDPVRQLIAGQQTIKGSLFGQNTWHAGTTWVLDGIVYVEAGGSLTIEWQGEEQPVLMSGPATHVFHGQVKV